MQDIDAAYMLNGSGDLDAGLSALLEVPDFDARSFAEQDLFPGDMMGMQPHHPVSSLSACIKVLNYNLHILNFRSLSTVTIIDYQLV